MCNCKKKRLAAQNLKSMQTTPKPQEKKVEDKEKKEDK